MTGAGRKALVLGRASPLRQAIVERLARAGHRVTHLDPDALELEVGAEILVHLDASLTGPPGVREGGPGSVEAAATVRLVEHAARAMQSDGFGRIVHLRAVPGSADPAGAMATFELAGTVALLRQTARRLAPVGITLNIITLVASDAVPGQRTATRSEVAALVAMLCDDQGGFVTAQSFSMVTGLD